MARFTTFLFDLDGTLIDHFAAIHRCYTLSLPTLGFPAPTLDQVRAAVGGGLEDAMLRFVPPERVSEAAAAYRRFWPQAMLFGLSAMPGALPLLQSLSAQGARLGIITNKLGASSRPVCEHLGFTPYLGAIVGAGDTAWLKPDRELTLHVLGLLGSPADGSVLVGDSPYDIDAAHNAGIACWAVTTGTHSKAQLQAAGADEIFPDLTALGSALELRA